MTRGERSRGHRDGGVAPQGTHGISRGFEASRFEDDLGVAAGVLRQIHIERDPLTVRHARERVQSLGEEHVPPALPLRRDQKLDAWLGVEGVGDGAHDAQVAPLRDLHGETMPTRRSPGQDAVADVVEPSQTADEGAGLGVRKAGGRRLAQARAHGEQVDGFPRTGARGEGQGENRREQEEAAQSEISKTSLVARGVRTVQVAVLWSAGSPMHARNGSDAAESSAEGSPWRLAGGRVRGPGEDGGRQATAASLGNIDGARHARPNDQAQEARRWWGLALTSERTCCWVHRWHETREVPRRERASIVAARTLVNDEG